MDAEQTNLRVIALQHAVNRQDPSTEYETVRIAEVYLAFLDGRKAEVKFTFPTPLLG